MTEEKKTYCYRCKKHNVPATITMSGVEIGDYPDCGLNGMENIRFFIKLKDKSKSDSK